MVGYEAELQTALAALLPSSHVSHASLLAACAAQHAIAPATGKPPVSLWGCVRAETSWR